MSSRTESIKLGDIAEKITKGTTPTTYGKAFVDKGINFFKVETIDIDGSFIKEKIVHIDRETHEKLLRRSQVEFGDILLTMAGAIGRVTRVEDSGLVPANINQAICLIRIKDKKWNPSYIKYFLMSPLGKSQILEGTVQTVQSNISLSQISNINVPFVVLDSQNKIVKILGDLDRKIELNRNINKTLEEIGQIFFKHYFIDNPDAKNWRERKLREFFPVKTGKKDANFSTLDGEYPFFTCSQNALRAPNYSFDGAALLLAGNGDFNLKYYRGKFEAYQRTYVLIPQNEKLLGFLYFLMSRFLNEITNGHRGSVINFITKGMIENFSVALPEDAKLENISGLFNQLTLNIEANFKQNEKLTAVRDSLLPRLMSGKISV
jgi:type I restriction enzyme S subunit